MTEAARRGGRTLGYFEALVAAILWGSSGIFAVHLFRMGVPPESLALLRPIVGVTVLGVYLGLTNRDALRIDARGLLILGAGGGLGIAVFQLAYQLSTDAVGVPTTVALLYLAPAMVVAAAGPLLHEWPTRTRVALAALTLTGVWLSVLGADDVSATFGTTGLGWGVLAGASYGAYTLFGRFAAPRYGSARTVLYSTIGACMILAVAVPILSGPIVLPPSSKAWLLLIAFGVLTMAVAHFLFFDALARVEASRASIATSIEPVTAALLATLLLGQGLSAIGWLGITLVVVGVAGVGFRKDRADAPNGL